jgi:hypothetical protein
MCSKHTNKYLSLLRLVELLGSYVVGIFVGPNSDLQFTNRGYEITVKERKNDDKNQARLDRGSHFLPVNMG